MDERYIAALDLGTAKISMTVAQVDGNDVQVIYYHETPSEGIRNSFVFNPQKVAGPLKAAIARAEEELRIKIRQAVVNLPRFEVRQETASASLERTDTDSVITSEEINYLKSNAIESYPLNDPSKEVMYGVVAQSFSADEYLNQLEADIEGMVSDTLEGNFKVYIGRKRNSDNVDRVMNLVGVAVAKKYFLPDVTAKAVLTPEERENGVALIEIGAGATSVTIYHKSILRHYSSIPFGGQTVTNDIQIECGISNQLAENIKLAYGVCCPDKLLTLKDKIIQINMEESGLCKQVSVKYISEIITARMDEIVDACLYKILESGFADALRNGVVITGGGAEIANLASLIKEKSGYNVRLGFPIKRFSYAGCSEVMKKTAVSSIGMILAAKENNWINCLDEPPVRKVEEPVAVPEPVVEAADPELENAQIGLESAQTDSVGTEPAYEEPQETVRKEETAPEAAVEVVEQPSAPSGWIQNVPDPEPVQETREETVKQEAAPQETKEKTPKKRFKITWGKPFEKFVGGITEGVMKAINNGYDGMEG